MDLSRTDVKEFVSNDVLGKAILSQFRYAITVPMVQLTSIALWSSPML